MTIILMPRRVCTFSGAYNAHLEEDHWRLPGIAGHICVSPHIQNETHLTYFCYNSSFYFFLSPQLESSEDFYGRYIDLIYKYNLSWGQILCDEFDTNC